MCGEGRFLMFVINFLSMPYMGRTSQFYMYDFPFQSAQIIT